MRRESVAAGALISLLVVAASACGGSTEDSRRAAATDALTSNERRLSRAESQRFVEWAAAFRACLLAHGAPVAPLTKTETHIEMHVPGELRAADVVPNLAACAQQQGGPPKNTSVQWRPGKVLLYLPKRCLLDPKVAQS
jgi:hypothetical protein